MTGAYVLYCGILIVLGSACLMPMPLLLPLQDPTGFVEKSELVAKVKSVASAGPQKAGGAAAPPAGYLYHAESGYFWGAADSMYFDAGTGTFYSPVSQQWFTRDATGSFQPVAAAS